MALEKALASERLAKGPHGYGTEKDLLPSKLPIITIRRENVRTVNPANRVFSG
jgi:hypothetical protein